MSYAETGLLVRHPSATSAYDRTWIIAAVPRLQGITAWLIGLGGRPEHVQSLVVQHR